MWCTRLRLGALGGVLLAGVGTAEAGGRPWVEVRGVYGGVPDSLMQGRSLAESGINAVWLGSGGITAERVALLHQHGAKVFAEFNTLHDASYLADHPDAAPVGRDGRPCPPPDGWQGVAPTHEGYRRYRMEAFRQLLAGNDIDGVWLDYHHAHASWERAEPLLPDTGFEPYSLDQFQRDTGIRLPEAPVPVLSALLLGQHRETWIQWRCDVLTDWVREFRQIVDEVRPAALLGTFHCPWTDTERDGALRAKLHIDLRAQQPHLDVFSPMPYHVRFGHADDIEWISRQTQWLGDYLGIEGRPGEEQRIWPIVQLSDWGDPVPPEHVRAALEHGTRRPATGVTVFAWGSVAGQPDKLAEMIRHYRGIAG